MSVPEIIESVISVLFLGFTVLVWVFLLIFGLVKWRTIRPWLRQGVLLGALILALKLPGLLAIPFLLDVQAFLPPDADASILPFLQAMVWVGVSVHYGFALVAVFHLALQIGLGQWLARPRVAYPSVLGTRLLPPGWGLAAALGVLGTLLTVLSFWTFGIQEGPIIENLKTMMPALEHLSAPLLLALFGPTILAAAIVEEILYRGILQQGMVRLLGGGRAAAIASIAFVSALWALGHQGMTEPFWAKYIQIFLLGLVFGALAHRRSVETAIVAHVALNASALLLHLIPLLFSASP